MRSSYIEGNYGQILKTFVITLKPNVLVEVGVLDGYSTLNLGNGVKVLRELFGMYSTLECYDLWEHYPYKHGEKEKVQEYINAFSMQDYIKLYQGDAFEVFKNYEDNSIDLLHFDISNDGEILEKLMETWNNKIRPGGVILFEGGSPERDEVEWMIKYKKKPIYPILQKSEIIKDNYNTVIYPNFPSLTAMFKKGGCLLCDLL